MQKEKLVLSKGIIGYLKELTLFFVLLIIMLGFYILEPRFLSLSNISNILIQNAYLVVASVGMSFVIIGGGIDLSVGYQISLVGVITAAAMQWFQLPVPVAVLLGLAAGTFLGFINGFFSVKLNMHPMVVTLATMAIYEGISYIITGSSSIYGLSDTFKYIGQGKAAGVSVSIIIMFAVLIAASFF